MFIIKLEPQEGTSLHAHQSQSHRERCWLEGWVEVPEALVETVLSCHGCCDLVLEEGALVDIIPKALPRQAAEPGPEEDREAMLVDHEYRLTLLELGVN